jgi:hypothetical protein
MCVVHKTLKRRDTLIILNFYKQQKDKKMKKLLLLFSLVLVTIVSFGQTIDNQFYFRVGYSSPSWSQFDLSEDLWTNNGIDSKVGAHFELGSIFMLKSILDADNMSFGINVDYLYANYNNFSGQEGAQEINLGHLKIGTKIGPSFTYSPMDNMAFDIYVKADFGWAAAAVIYEEEPSDADDYYVAKPSVGVSTGVNFRYGVLILGAEFNTISKELESDDYSGLYLQEIIDEGFGTGGNTTKSKLPVMNFTIGMSF